MKRLTAIAALVAALASGCSSEQTQDQVDLGVVTFPDLGADVHLSQNEVRQILDGEVAPPVYNSDPPTSGPHALQAAACGIFRQPVPDVYQLHNLEIGVIVIQYSPALEGVDVERIERFARTLGERLIVAPRPGLATPVVATAWTRMLSLEAIDEQRLRAFYDAFVGKGTTQGSCPLLVDEGA